VGIQEVESAMEWRYMFGVVDERHQCHIRNRSCDVLVVVLQLNAVVDARFRNWTCLPTSFNAVNVVICNSIVLNR